MRRAAPRKIALGAKRLTCIRVAKAGGTSSRLLSLLAWPATGFLTPQTPSLGQATPAVAQMAASAAVAGGRPVGRRASGPKLLRAVRAVDAALTGVCAGASVTNSEGALAVGGTVMFRQPGAGQAGWKAAGPSPAVAMSAKSPRGRQIVRQGLLASGSVPAPFLLCYTLSGAGQPVCAPAVRCALCLDCSLGRSSSAYVLLNHPSMRVCNRVQHR